MEYPAQLDFVWLAVDATGALAAMITAGQGPVSAAVLSSEEDVILGLEEVLLALPAIGAARKLACVPDPCSFAALSERGLFVYDWSDAHRTLASATGAYERVAAPSVVLRLDDLPADLRRLAAPIDGAFGAPMLKVG